MAKRQILSNIGAILLNSTLNWVEGISTHPPVLSGRLSRVEFMYIFSGSRYIKEGLESYFTFGLCTIQVWVKVKSYICISLSFTVVQFSREVGSQRLQTENGSIEDEGTFLFTNSTWAPKRNDFHLGWAGRTKKTPGGCVEVADWTHLYQPCRMRLEPKETIPRIQYPNSWNKGKPRNYRTYIESFIWGKNRHFPRSTELSLLYLS